MIMLLIINIKCKPDRFSFCFNLPKVGHLFDEEGNIKSPPYFILSTASIAFSNLPSVPEITV